MRYLAPESGVTLKTGLGFVQGHWKWHHLIDRIQVLIRLHSNYGDILYRLRDIATWVWSDILMAADCRHVTLLSLIDLSAAFDCVVHGILLRRLEISFGLKDCIALVQLLLV